MGAGGGQCVSRSLWTWLNPASLLPVAQLALSRAGSWGQPHPSQGRELGSVAEPTPEGALEGLLPSSDVATAVHPRGEPQQRNRNLSVNHGGGRCSAQPWASGQQTGVRAVKPHSSPSSCNDGRCGTKRQRGLWGSGGHGGMQKPG